MTTMTCSCKRAWSQGSYSILTGRQDGTVQLRTLFVCCTCHIMDHHGTLSLSSLAPDRNWVGLRWLNDDQPGFWEDWRCLWMFVAVSTLSYRQIRRYAHADSKSGHDPLDIAWLLICAAGSKDFECQDHRWGFCKPPMLFSLCRRWYAHW